MCLIEIDGRKWYCSDGSNHYKPLTNGGAVGHTDSDMDVTLNILSFVKSNHHHFIFPTFYPSAVLKVFLHFNLSWMSFNPGRPWHKGRQRTFRRARNTWKPRTPRQEGPHRDDGNVGTTR